KRVSNGAGLGRLTPLRKAGTGHNPFSHPLLPLLSEKRSSHHGSSQCASDQGAMKEAIDCVAAVEPARVFGKVGAQIFGADPVVGAHQPGLRAADEVMSPREP